MSYENEMIDLLKEAAKEKNVAAIARESKSCPRGHKVVFYRGEQGGLYVSTLQDGWGLFTPFIKFPGKKMTREEVRSVIEDEIFYHETEAY